MLIDRKSSECSTLLILKSSDQQAEIIEFFCKETLIITDYSD